MTQPNNDPNPKTPPTATGSRGGNMVLTSLLSIGAAVGATVIVELFRAGTWPVSAGAAGLTALVCLATYRWQVINCQRSPALAMKYWQMGTPIHFGVVIGVGLVLILGFALDPVASLLPSVLTAVTTIIASAWALQDALLSPPGPKSDSDSSNAASDQAADINSNNTAAGTGNTDGRGMPDSTNPRLAVEARL